jgi:insulysin
VNLACFLLCYVYVQVVLHCTDLGMAHVDDIVTAAYQYIALLQHEGPQQRIYEEIRDLAAVRFRFASKGAPISYVTRLVRLL